MMAAGRRHLTIAAEPDPVDAWRAALVCTKTGEYRATPHNLALILERDPALQGLFNLDEFANRIIFTRNPPWGIRCADEIAEQDAFEAAAWLGQPLTYSIASKPAQVAEAIEAVARRHRVHPVRVYLNATIWDGIERIPTLFSAYFGAEVNDYHQDVALSFMLSAAARIFDPGCKVDQMLVLEGPQGAGKTRGVRALFGGDDWYVDCQRSPAEKDFYQDIVGKWAAEIGEMTSFSKADYNKVKQTITAQADVYRPSYGRYSRTFKRQCVFIGTVNNDAWQRDPTGGRRYLPVRVGAVNVDALLAVRDQLWSETVVRYRRGEPWWCTPARAGDEQDQRFQDDSWTEPILHWLLGKEDARNYENLRLCARDKHGHVTECTVTELLLHAVHVDLARHDLNGQTRAGVIMSRLGWKKYRPIRLGSRQWCWYAPDAWEWPLDE